MAVLPSVAGEGSLALGVTVVEDAPVVELCLTFDSIEWRHRNAATGALSVL